ncbi:MAG: alpha-L-fucosidase [Planctomycetaceae bacterium]|nr:alpha-L-fucosidase [Planctomycetaceae bacterium]
MCANSSTASEQHRIIQIPQQYGGGTFQRTTHPDAQWFGEGRLGLFMHWGINSCAGDADISWGMIANTSWDRGLKNRNKITPAEYYALAKKFYPDNYDPEKWLAAAKDAGFTYAVLTTKHHDGYTLWPSQFGEMGTRVYMGGRDLVAPYVAACRKLGLKVGLYYSPPDFYFNREYMSFGCASDPEKTGGMNHEPREIPPEPPEWKEKNAAHIRGQIKELLTWYGKVDLLWFDGGPNVISMDELRAMQPGMVIDPRMHGYGDFDTWECGMGSVPPPDWWELCERWNIGPWGYTYHDETYWPLRRMLSRFTHTRCWGGNYLLNVAPNRHGELPEVYYRRMGELKAWMDKNKESVFGTGRGPFPQQSNLPVTTRQGQNVWYVHVPADFSDAPRISGAGKPAAVTMLATGKKLKTSFKAGELTIDLPAALRSDNVDVIKIAW